jgi:hypothetical protein
MLRKVSSGVRITGSVARFPGEPAANDEVATSAKGTRDIAQRLPRLVSAQFFFELDIS